MIPLDCKSTSVLSTINTNTNALTSAGDMASPISNSLDIPTASLYTAHTAEHRSEKKGSCRLLLLPAELRNEVWQFAFSPDNNDEANLVCARGPSFALLLTCHQIYQEGLGMYVDAWRAFSGRLLTSSWNEAGTTTAKGAAGSWSKFETEVLSAI